MSSAQTGTSIWPAGEVEKADNLQAGNPIGQLLAVIEGEEEEHFVVDGFGAPRLRRRLDEETQNVNFGSWPGK
jgi:hypothetical protein